MAVDQAHPMPATAAQAEPVGEGRKTWPVMVAAAVCPLLFLAFVWHFSYNALQFDDWSVVGFLDHPTLGRVWAQHGEPRIPATNLLFLLSNSVGHFDARLVILFSACALIGGYLLILACFRRYLLRPLSPLSVLAVGVVWFSLADTQNALWAFQVGWYMVLLFLGVVLSGLLLPQRWTRLGFGLAVAGAILGSLSWDTGFVLWPLGLIAIMWPAFRVTRRAVIWVVACLVMVGTYLIGYNPHSSSCQVFFGCVPKSPLSHPVDAIRYYLAVLGDIFPTSYFRIGSPENFFGKFTPPDPTRFELLGLALLLASAYVIIASVRRRRTSERVPLPLLLVLFGLVFVGLVTWGRLGEGISGATDSNRYAMASLVVVTGLLMFLWKNARPTVTGRVVIGVVAVFLAFQVVQSSIVGWSNASNTRSYLALSARTMVNASRIPPSIRSCELARFFVTATEVRTADRARLAEFAPDQAAHYLAIGPPPPERACLDQEKEP
jgi:hypothetical protein